MEETPVTPPAETQPAPGCTNCGNLAVLHGYPTALCSECRDHFTRFPVPKWLWLFAGAIGIIVLFSLFTLPKNISVGVALEKGIKAEKQHRYLTAQKEFEKVVQKEPAYMEGNGHLMIAAFYNGDFSTMANAFKQIQGKEIDDHDFYAQLNDIVTKATSYFRGDSLKEVSAPYDSTGMATPDTVLWRYIRRHEEDTYAKGLLSYTLFNEKQYNASDSLLKKLLETDAGNVLALRIGASLHREINDYPTSLAYCDRMLAINQEDTYAMASKARTYFKMKNDKEGFRLTLKALDIASKDGYAIATLALGYHLTGDTKKRDELMNRYRNDSSVQESMGYVRDVISKKEFFRN